MKCWHTGSAVKPPLLLLVAAALVGVVLGESVSSAVT